MRLKYFVSVITIAWMLGAIGAASQTIGNSIDLNTAYDAQIDGVTVEIYAASPNPCDSFLVSGYDHQNNLVYDTLLSSAETSLTIQDVSFLGLEAVQITGLDGDGNPIEESQLEPIVTELPAPMPMAPRKLLGASTTGQLDITLNSFDSGSFPMIYMSVAVTEDGAPIDSLVQEDFYVEEDGRLQTDLFHVTPPDQTGGARIADIVFLIDTSGSMGGEIAAVRNNSIQFANALAASGVDYRLGLVQFGNSSGANPRIIGGGLTADAEEFKSWVGTLSARGGYEPGFGAINLGIGTYNFRPGTQKIFILITDEDSDGGNKQETINLALANDVTIHTCVRCSYAQSNNHYCDDTSVRAATGGLLFNVVGPYDAILDTIVGQIKNTYLVRYRTDNLNCDGLERNVEIFASNLAMTTSATAQYTPCGAPIIERTAETIALHSQTITENTTVTIAATVIDLVTPFVQDVTLFVRTTGATPYQQFPMSPIGGDVYSAEIPAGLVQSPGLDYYIRATDGQVSATDPSTEPATNPYQLAVLPNIAPVITHTPPQNALCNTDVELTMYIEDDTYGVADLYLFYRKQGELLWNSILVNAFPSPYPVSVAETATIPADQVVEPAIEYYIQAVDDFGVATVWPVTGADGPQEVTVYCNRSPVAMCQDISEAADQSCTALANVNAGSYDPDGDPLTIQQNPPPPYGLGSTVVTLTVSDGQIEDSCQATVVVNDLTDPAISCPADVVLEYPADTAPAAVGEATVADNCSVNSASWQDDTVPGCGNTFAMTRHWDAADDSGNTAACTQSITVVDTTPPQISLNGPAALTLECHLDAYIELGATVSDNSDDDLSVVIGGDPVDNNTPGTYVVSYSATDRCGNAAQTVLRTVSVVDTTPPVIECPADLVLEYPADISPSATGEAFTADNCGVNPTEWFDEAVPNCGSTFTVMRYWEVADNSGNTANCTQVIDVVDTTPPIISLNDEAKMTLECHLDTYLEPGAVVTDNSGLAIESVIGGDIVDVNVPGTYVVTYNAVDACGNAATQVTRTVIVQDTTPAHVTVSEMIELWPPHHDMHTFNLSDCVVSVEDDCEGSLAVDAVGTILSMYSDEPEDAKGGGDGKTVEDMIILSNSSFAVRAERQGKLNGRVYGITFEVLDTFGNSTVETCYVGVPHDQDGDPPPDPIDDGAESGYVI
ncbi:MAG: DUF5011 domain-containing protein [Myxococcota bacterium]|nr:DUF5011 domain-containing protein [Myxococcota bacterium]